MKNIAIYHRDELKFLFADSRISNEMILVYLYLRTFDIEQTGIVWPSSCAISDDLGIKRPNLIEIIMKLEAIQMIKKVKQTEDRNNSAYEFAIKHKYASTGKVLLEPGYSFITRNQIKDLRDMTKMDMVIKKDTVYDGIVIKKKSTPEEIKEIEDRRKRKITIGGLKIYLVIKTYRNTPDKSINNIMTGGNTTLDGNDRRYRRNPKDNLLLARLAEKHGLSEFVISYFRGDSALDEPLKIIEID